MSSHDVEDVSPASRVYHTPELFGRIRDQLDGPSQINVLVLEKTSFAERASWLWRRATKRAVLHLPIVMPAQGTLGYFERSLVYYTALEHLDWHARGTHTLKGEACKGSPLNRCETCKYGDYVDEKRSQSWMEELQRQYPNLRSISYFGGLENRTWAVRQVTTGGQASFETEIIVDAHLGPADSDWEPDESDFDDIANDPSYRFKLTVFLDKPEVDILEMTRELLRRSLQVKGAAGLAGIKIPYTFIPYTHQGLDWITDLISKYNRQASAPFAHIVGSCIPFSFEAFSRFIVSVGHSATWIDLRISSNKTLWDGHDCMTLDDLARIVKLVRAHCPLLEYLSLDLHDARRECVLPNNNIPISSLGLGGRLREIFLVLFDNPWVQAVPTADPQPAGQLSGLIARNVACLGRRHSVFGFHGVGAQFESNMKPNQFAIEVEDYVEALHRLEPRRLDNVRFADWDYLGIQEPADLLRLKFDEQDRPVSLKMQEALDEIGEINNWFATLEQEKAVKRAKRDAALETVKQMTFGGPVGAKLLPSSKTRT